MLFQEGERRFPMLRQQADWGDSRPNRSLADFVAQIMSISGSLAVGIVAVSAFFWLLYKTRPGRAFRAIAEDPDGARLVGIGSFQPNASEAGPGVYGIGEARFDLAVPDAGEGYGITLSDRLGAAVGRRIATLRPPIASPAGDGR